MLDNQHQYKRLLVVCRQMHELFPNRVRSVHSLAVALEKNGMDSEAMARYRETIDLEPSNWEAHSALATLLAENNQLEEATKHFEIATELHPDYVNCVNLMTLYLNSGQEEKALKAGKQLLQAARTEKSAAEVEQIQLALQKMESSIKALPGR
jgi:Flp pilus assembly protein TadD